MVNGVVTELKFYLAEKWLSKSKQDAKKRCRFELKQDFEEWRETKLRPVMSGRR
jgi:hypothetical protein